MGAQPQIEIVVGISLDSPGGDLIEAEKFAGGIHSAHLNTVVGPHQQCASACFLIFAAGARRFAARDAEIGVHSAASSGGKETLMSMAATVAMARDAAAYGVPDVILGKIVNTEPGRIQVLTQADLIAMGVTILPSDQGTASSSSSALAGPSPASPAIGGSFSDGLADRTKWENWIAACMGCSLSSVISMLGSFQHQTNRGGARLGARECRATTLYSVGSARDPHHEAVIRFSGEAPGRQ